MHTNTVLVLTIEHYYLNRFIISLSIKFPNVNTVCVVTPSPFYRRPILHNDSCFDSPWGGRWENVWWRAKDPAGTTLLYTRNLQTLGNFTMSLPSSSCTDNYLRTSLLITIFYSFTVYILLFLCFLYLPISISLWISASLFSLYLCLSSYLYIALNLCFTGSLFSLYLCLSSYLYVALNLCFTGSLFSLYLQSFLLYLSQSYLCFYPCLFFFIYIYLSFSISLFLYLFCCIYLCPFFVSILVSFSFSLSISISLYLSIFLYPSLHISSFFSLSSSLPLFSLSLECCPPFSKIFAF